MTGVNGATVPDFLTSSVGVLMVVGVGLAVLFYALSGKLRNAVVAVAATVIAWIVIDASGADEGWVAAHQQQLQAVETGPEPKHSRWLVVWVAGPIMVVWVAVMVLILRMRRPSSP